MLNALTREPEQDLQISTKTGTPGQGFHHRIVFNVVGVKQGSIFVEDREGKDNGLFGGVHQIQLRFPGSQNGQLRELEVGELILFGLGLPLGLVAWGGVVFASAVA